MATPDMDVIKEIPGYKVILKAILKSQIQQLVEQLASTTDEESVILTASVTDGTLCHLGSDSGKNFLEDNEDFKSQFLGFCLKRHHRRKQEQEREKERQEAMRNIPTTPPRFAGPRQGFMVRSPRFPSPRQQGIVPIALTRASGGMGMRSPGARHEPYPMNRAPKRPLSFDGGRGPGPAQPPARPIIGNTETQAIKIEPDDPDDADTEPAGAGDHVASEEGGSSSHSMPSPAQGPDGAQPKPEREDDARSESSSSTIPNEPSDLKYSDATPPEGLSLGSDLSNLIPTVDNAGSETQDSQASPSAPQTPGGSNSGLDQSVNVKVESITESEMELEITGVELGSRQAPVPDSMVPQDSWGPGMAATGSPADLPANQMEYTNIHHPPVPMNPNWSGSSLDPPQITTLVPSSLMTPGVPEHLLNNEDPTIARKKFLCKVCGLAMKSMSEFKMHMRVHTGEKPFACRMCGKRFKRNSHLKGHMVIHIKEIEEATGLNQ